MFNTHWHVKAAENNGTGLGGPAPRSHDEKNAQTNAYLNTLANKR